MLTDTVLVHEMQVVQLFVSLVEIPVSDEAQIGAVEFPDLGTGEFDVVLLAVIPDGADYHLFAFDDLFDTFPVGSRGLFFFLIAVSHVVDDVDTGGPMDVSDGFFADVKAFGFRYSVWNWVNERVTYSSISFLIAV